MVTGCMVYGFRKEDPKVFGATAILVLFFFAISVLRPTKATQRPTARPLSLPIYPLDTRPRAPAAAEGCV